VASLERDKLVVSYYLRAYEIWPDKKGWPLLGVAIYEGWPLLRRDKLVVSYYLTASEIWPDKKGWPLLGVALYEGWPLLKGTIS
jgi:hypothetical protein